MKFSTSLIAATAALLATTVSGKDGRTFAVLRFLGDGELTRCRIDPIVNPGGVAPHLHSVMGGNAFSASMPGTAARKSTCTNAQVRDDLSNYWTPSLYFDHRNGTFTPVEMFYMNVYYFFEGTDDEIKAFPEGLRILAGNAGLRAPPAEGFNNNIDAGKGACNGAGMTCPRSDKAERKFPELYPANSDGKKGYGIGNPRNAGEGVGFPDKKCDGYASPLRADLHFPSCYNPAAGVENYKENMAYPTHVGNGKQNCPKGWIHVPALFYEVYWNTPKFDDLWEEGQGYQPFVFSNGDATGYSFHGDFLNGWKTEALQDIIDRCDTGTRGMVECPGVVKTTQEEAKACKVECPIHEEAAQDQPYTPIPGLFGGNKVTGYSANPVVPPSNNEKPPVVPKPSATDKPSKPTKPIIVAPEKTDKPSKPSKTSKPEQPPVVTDSPSYGGGEEPSLPGGPVVVDETKVITITRTGEYSPRPTVKGGVKHHVKTTKKVVVTKTAKPAQATVKPAGTKKPCSTKKAAPKPKPTVKSHRKHRHHHAHKAGNY